MSPIDEREDRWHNREMCGYARGRDTQAWREPAR